MCVCVVYNITDTQDQHMALTKTTFLFTLNLSRNESTPKTKHPDPRTAMWRKLSQSCTGRDYSAPPPPFSSNNGQVLARRLMVRMNSVKVTGIWKRNLIWTRNLLEFDIICLKCCFRVKVGALRPGKFARRDANLGGTTCVVSVDIPPPPSKQC